MAFDGIVIASLVKELNETITGGRINKISQPERDELLLTVKNNSSSYKLLICASASLPLLYLTENTKPNPMTVPGFCMLLRKHLNNARIISVSQPGLERVVDITVEHLNELGDLCTKHLMIELMGKYSNIIFCDDQNKIIDSIKHISSLVSSVREVLPGRNYFIPGTDEKCSPYKLTEEYYRNVILKKPVNTAKAIYTSLTGFSPLAANEVCVRASLDGGMSIQALTGPEQEHLYGTLCRFIEGIAGGEFSPNIIYEENTPIEFASYPLTCFAGLKSLGFDSVSRMLETYYASRNTVNRIRQKSADLRRITANAIDRTRKKRDLQQKQLKDTEKRDKYRIYGELLTTYGYQLETGLKSYTTTNFYTGEEITIPLDPMLSPLDNAKKYFERYNKLKRTYEALSDQLTETEQELLHLESISTSLDIALLEEDLVQVKEELTEAGYMKRKYQPGVRGQKKARVTSKPFHYVSSDGYDIYVGKNNYQNEELTFKFASGNDWWFHAKGMAGSHVIVKNSGTGLLPDKTYEEAGALAAYYSKGRDGEKVEIDYTEKKNVKKPAKGKPGFVVYYTNYSLLARPDITGLRQIS
ncbi:Rqc2 family fibronectin-binding protein [Anaerolentibacter hominis]|uniref:Rqc2 family fibronectin-binding protein n=1 Tax=Anaerolentibacter hominis TaxID=3079009 RepID=UPI0031B820BA